MIVHDLKQGTPEWLEARLGIPTASCFDRIITAKTMKMSASAQEYACKLAAEIALGRSLDMDLSHNTDVQRGNELEPYAADAYAYDKGVTLETVGFITNDARTYGASPDRLVGEDGLLEIKCPRPEKHMLYAVRGFGTDYWVQVQAQMFVTGRQWTDRFSYCQGLPPVCQRTERDPVFQKALMMIMPQFETLRQEALGWLREQGSEEV